MNSAEIVFAVDHPTAAGHFPGNPIIPGAVLLNEVARRIGSGLVSGVRSAKFHGPVRPGDQVRLNWQATDSGEIKFECLMDDRLILSGIMMLQ